MTTVNLFDDYDEQSQNDLRRMKFLDLDTLQKGYAGNDPFEGIRTSTSFEEVSFAKKFDLKDKCKPFTADFYKESIDAKELIADLRMNNNNNQFFFYYQRYLKKSFNNYSGISPTVLAPVSSGSSYENNPFSYNDENGKVVYANLNIALNERACYVNVNNPGFTFTINDNEIKYAIKFTYQDALNQRIDNKKTQETNDFTIEDQYEAIIISTASGKDLLALADQIGHRRFIETELKSLFVEKLRKANTGSVLKFLYENIPVFVLNSLLKELTETVLWNHFMLLTDYDDKGLLSGWHDGSSALINVLRAFGNSKTLFKKFKTDPVLVMRIYENLDDSSMYEDQIISNRILFANLLMALCVNNGFTGLNIIPKTFYYGDNYKFKSDILNSEKSSEFSLQQIRLIPLFGADILYPLTQEIDEDKGAIYLPFDLVSFLDTSLKDNSSMLVPAIFVKALSDEKEKQETETNIRIGFDILAIVLGVVTIVTTANPAIFALAVADIGLAIIDGGVQAFREEILKLDGGADFIKTWEKIYLVGGIILAGPFLIETLLTTGPRLLKLAQAAKNFKTVNFLKTCLLKVLLEIEIANFTKNTVKFFENETELVLATKGVLDNFKLDKLYLKGAFVVKGSVQTTKGIEEQVAIIYKGEAVVVANKWEFAKATKDIIKTINNEKKLVEVLEGMSAKAKYLKTLPKDCDIYVEGSSFVFKDLSVNEDIGLVLIKDNYLEFAIYRKGVLTKITGQQIFNSLIGYLKLNKISHKGIKGLWSVSSDNTIAFNKAIQQQLSNEKAAFETWTGKRALEQGFNKVKIDNLIPNNPPYTSISVTFYK